MSDQTTREHETTRPQGAGRQAQARTHPASSRDGFIDFYGEASIGWVLSGWIRTDWNGSIGEPEVELRFDNETVTGRALMVLFERPDVESIGRGCIIVLSGEPGAVGDLLQVTLHGPAENFNLHLSNPIEHLADNVLLDRTRSALEHTVVAGNRGRLLALLSASAYTGEETLGRLKWPVYMEIDETFFVPPSGLVLRGWFLDPFSTVAAIRVRGTGAMRTLEPRDWVPIRRPDVLTAVGARHGVSNEDCGFVSLRAGRLRAR